MKEFDIEIDQPIPAQFRNEQSRVVKVCLICYKLLIIGFLIFLAAFQSQILELFKKQTHV